MKSNPATRLQSTLKTGEHRGVNPSITDSATYQFDDGPSMTACFEGKAKEAYLYNRHWNPTIHHLSTALSAMENTESAWITGSGMAAITNTILQLCSAGDHLISSLTSYGGTYAFLKNLLPRFGIETTFVNITNHESVIKAIRPNTKLIYTESVTNPLLQVSDIYTLSHIAHDHHLKLVVDNTFTPMIITPTDLGADITVYSMTKFINGKNDAVAGAICGSEDFINDLINVTSGVSMLLGPVLDPIRASMIHKNLFTLHIRMRQHSRNGLFIAQKLEDKGMKVIYPGLSSHPQHQLMTRIFNETYGYGGMLAVDLKTSEKASDFMVAMQKRHVGYIAVSLGYYKTLFSNSGTSTSSEIPREKQLKMGLSKGLVRFSIGLDENIEQTWALINESLNEVL